MSTPPIDRLEIEVGNFPLDSSFIEHNGTYTLFLRPQTFSSAVRHVRNVLPHITLEAAEQMVREQCPEFKDFDELFGLTTPPVPSIERPADLPVKEDTHPERSKRRRRAVLVAALLPALAASWALGRYTNVADTEPVKTTASAPDPSSPAVDQAPFSDSKFEFFAGSSKIVCDPISTLEAECTDADGMVMSTKAATGPDSTIFTFSYGSERIGLRIFYDAEYAKTWARQDGSRELYPNMKVHARYVLWGTDPKRIKEYVDLLVDADRQAAAGPNPMGGATPLPPRLAALTLGTLGLDSDQVGKIMFSPASASTTADAPVMVAARLVLGLDTTPPWSVSHEGDDIVALAAGIGPHPPTDGGTASGPVTEEPDPGTTAPAGEGTSTTTPTEGDTTAPTAPPTTTPTETKPPTEPTTPTPSTPPTTTTPPTTEQPKPPTTETPSTPKPPAEETPPPPVEETPPPPVEETPPPPVEESPTTPTPPSETPAPPVEEDPAPPAEETPAPPVEETPSTPPAAEETPAPDVDTAGEGGADDDLLILNSAWTVAA
ncbi:hypothetical protein [Streptomyces collinus]|uniref:hypothetical protein n=1 Tax=Streptomyces collinus TaxID=42684 RepID=UPI00363BECC6